MNWERSRSLINSASRFGGLVQEEALQFFYVYFTVHLLLEQSGVLLFCEVGMDCIDL
jgi:hypothetical protein